MINNNSIGNFSDSTSAENLTNSINLIDNYTTSMEKNKIPFKKMNYKLYFYKKRINYGRLEKVGFVNNELRILPALEILNKEENSNQNSSSTNTNVDSLTNCISLDYGTNFTNNSSSIEDKFNNNNTKLPPLDENLFYKLLYNSDLDFNIRHSKRETKLRKMLETKLKKLMQLSNIKKDN